MGCISTPMPNHLSTRLTTHLLMSGGGVEMGRMERMKRIEEKRRTTPKKYIRTDQGNRTC